MGTQAKSAPPGKGVAKVGRPSSFTDEIGDEICERLCDGESMVSICEDAHMPHQATVYRWLQDDALESFREKYAGARVVQAHTKFDEIDRVARHATPESVHVARLQIDALKWQTSKLHPKVYGDRQTVEHAGKIQTEDLTVTPEEAIAKSPALQEALRKALAGAGEKGQGGDA